MTTKFIELNRQFTPWTDGDKDTIDAYFAFRHSFRTTTWQDLLDHSRVVVLAEAGGGKTEELKARRDALLSEGKHAFYATVQDVAKDGLDSASGKAADLAAWRESDQPAWFFVDSVDEAKLDGIRLETALRKIAEGIEGARSRAHIIVSGRYSDWEFRADLARLEHYLPVPSDAPPPPPSSDAVLIDVLEHGSRRKEKEKDKKEQQKPLVVLMGPLDEERVRAFAKGKSVANIDAFMRAIDDANLWQFAGRPMDLDWLTSYWGKHGRFGNLAAMMEESVAERLREPSTTRPRDAISTEMAIRAAERIGAALVFGRADKFLIPDSEERRPANAELNIAEVLPDWSDDHRNRLLSRPVFDPATFGRIRLHNDNEGNVRSFLAARWLRERRKTNCSWQTLKDMLFAESYGISVIKPSLQKTAAWLAIWDSDVAREIIARVPGLLLTAGDPASLSLDVRRRALDALVNEILGRDEYMMTLDQDCLRRFSTADLVPDIKRIWTAHKANEEIRSLILRMIWLGRLSDCLSIAEEAAFANYADSYTAVFAGRAVLALGDRALRDRYAAHVRSHIADLRPIAVWETLEKMFPGEIGIDSFLEFLAAMPDEAKFESAGGLEYRAPRMISLVTDRKDLGILTVGFLDQLGAREGEVYAQETEKEKAYFPAIEATAHALMLSAGPDETPEAALRAAFRLGERRFYRSRDKVPDVANDLRETSARREKAMWAAVEHFNADTRMGGKLITNENQLEFMGWSPELQMEDADWLLGAVRSKPRFEDRVLALSCVFHLWHQAERSAALFSRVEDVVRSDARLAEMLKVWMEPRKLSPEEIALDRQIAEQRAKFDKQKAERDKSWIEFVAKLRADPNQLRHLPPPTPKNIDGRLFYLWELLSSLDDYRSHYAIADVSGLEPIVGKEVAEAERDALIAMWRQWRPRLESEREPDKRNSYSKIDCMGIAGVTLEALKVPNWPRNLTSDEARLAAIYGTLELNGFPNWMPKLAAVFSNETRSVLMGEINSELDDMSDGPRYGVLHDISYGPVELARLVAQPLLAELQRRAEIKPGNVTLALRALGKALPADANELYALCIDKFGKSSSPELEGAYFAAAFRANPSAAIVVLTAKLNSLKPAAQTQLALRMLPQLFGDRFREEDDQAALLPFEVLHRLLLLAFQTIRVEEDNNRASGVVYSPDARDAAERARGMLFNLLAGTPGRATFEALLQIAETKGFPIPRDRLIDIAHNRAAQDAEHSPWASGEARAVEQECDTAPATPDDLQRVAMRRIADIQHDLLHSDFAQGLTVKALPNEREVQKWVANELNNRQRRAYSVERESHVVDEKEPDIRLRAKVSDASLPVEIKVAESWSLQELEEALDDQLGGRYLRDKDAKRGVLLLVHLTKRMRGWPDQKRKPLSFEELVAHLKARADKTAAESPSAPQAQIAVIDVSSLTLPPRNKKRPSRSKAVDPKRRRKGPPKVRSG
jgi:hypothetical protein